MLQQARSRKKCKLAFLGIRASHFGVITRLNLIVIYPQPMRSLLMDVRVVWIEGVAADHGLPGRRLGRSHDKVPSLEDYR